MHMCVDSTPTVYLYVQFILKTKPLREKFSSVFSPVASEQLQLFSDPLEQLL